LDDMQEMAIRYNFGLEEALPERLSATYSTSAKVGDNVEKAFQSLGHMILSDQIPEDPIKDMYESLVAMGVEKEATKGTPIGALDAIFVDVCEEFEDDRVAMSLIRQEIVRAGVDVRGPSKEGLLKFVEYLAEAESEYKKAKEVDVNRDRRMQWVRGAEG
ncbi:MAG: hypothetical protein ACE5IO_02345, partial [Thermoplasmata archaeon]